VILTAYVCSTSGSIAQNLPGRTLATAQCCSRRRNYQPYWKGSIGVECIGLCRLRSLPYRPLLL